MDIARVVLKLLAPYARRLTNLLARGTVSASSSETKMQTVQLKLLAGEAKDAVEHFEPYGFTSRPKVGAEHVTVFLDGDRSHGIAIVVADRRFRLKGLKEGEVALFTDEGDKVHFKRGREIEIVSGTRVSIQAPLTAISQDVTIGGSLHVAGLITGQGGLAVSGGDGATVTGDVRVSQGDVSADGINLKTHVHGGVEPGGGTTAPPQ